MRSRVIAYIAFAEIALVTFSTLLIGILKYTSNIEVSWLDVFAPAIIAIGVNIGIVFVSLITIVYKHIKIEYGESNMYEV